MIKRHLFTLQDPPQKKPQEKKIDEFEKWFASECYHDVVLRYHKRKFRQLYDDLIKKK
jgi:hypothetical protein